MKETEHKLLDDVIYNMNHPWELKKGDKLYVIDHEGCHTIIIEAIL